ncbi:hypothetical protein GAP32_082 [Cronobacter phage vB_CsaM_GAP32]|uniref:Uncharacterized protein n=1 Tax=Cronobacter phage vB_CsaM_GAP32 TaxID=1141136 RepID=K4F9G3_9CAUD|nr:hypothetical protein GAP32_082 [Cronobacter phage vB_CsaM_GAP32]AFC21530.1 hypothetical protein GAP32_082 [Cronobacter phage vB_CsaM_GAP32]
MSNLVTITTVKVLYKNHEFSLIPKGVVPFNKLIEMVRYVKEIGDIAFIVDGDMYFDEGAFFNLTMKYCNEYVII